MTRTVNYNDVASEYDRRYQLFRYPGIEAELLRCTSNAVAPRVLEVGCGSGHWLSQLLQRDVPATGLDASLGMLAEARVRAPGATLVRGRAEQLPFADRSFDCVVCINAVHHFAVRDAFMREARRVLRGGGVLLVIGLDPHAGRDRWSIYDYFVGTLEIDKARYASGDQLRQEMASAGFHGCQTYPVEHLEQRVDARQALASGQLAKSFTSQLSVLSDAEYAAGVQRIEHAIERREAAGEVLQLTSDLWLYATRATIDPS